MMIQSDSIFKAMVVKITCLFFEKYVCSIPTLFHSKLLLDIQEMFQQQALCLPLYFHTVSI